MRTRLLMLTLFAACGDPNGPLKIKGQQFEVQSRFYARTTNGQSAHGLALFLGNQPDLCNAWRSGAYPASESIVQVNFYRAEGGTSVDVEPGTYGVFNTGSGDQATAQIAGGGHFVVAQAGAYTSACKTATDLGAGLKGSVTFSGGDPITGSYDLHFANGALAGEFDAPLCDLTAAQFCPHQ
jgi:hypothetical protein